MRLIQVPTSETVWPAKKRRKLRWRRALQACEKPLAGGIASTSGTTVGWGRDGLG